MPMLSAVLQTLSETLELIPGRTHQIGLQLLGEKP